MLIDDEDSTLKIIENELKNKDNLLALCFEYCDIDDIINISTASKKFYKISKYMDYKFEEAIEKNYFSNYTNYE